jgi:hypothetical protein
LKNEEGRRRLQAEELGEEEEEEQVQEVDWDSWNVGVV